MPIEIIGQLPIESESSRERSTSSPALRAGRSRLADISGGLHVDVDPYADNDMTQIRGVATQLQENSGDLLASLQKVVRPLQPGVPDAQRLRARSTARPTTRLNPSSSRAPPDSNGQRIIEVLSIGTDPGSAATSTPGSLLLGDDNERRRGSSREPAHGLAIGRIDGGHDLDRPEAVDLPRIQETEGTRQAVTPATHLVELQAMFSLQVLQAFPDCTATDAQYRPQLLTGVESPVLK